MKIIREGIAAMRYVPERQPDLLGFSCDQCQCMFEAERDETTPVSLYGNHGRIVETSYTCCCPNCKVRLSAESFYYKTKE